MLINRVPKRNSQKLAPRFRFFWIIFGPMMFKIFFRGGDFPTRVPNSEAETGGFLKVQ
jgi:hypothetical protein